MKQVLASTDTVLKYIYLQDFSCCVHVFKRKILEFQKILVALCKSFAVYLYGPFQAVVSIEYFCSVMLKGIRYHNLHTNS